MSPRVSKIICPGCLNNIQITRSTVTFPHRDPLNFAILDCPKCVAAAVKEADRLGKDIDPEAGIYRFKSLKAFNARLVRSIIDFDPDDPSEKEVVES